MRALIKFYRKYKFHKNEDGSMMVEAALGLPLLISIIIGILEIGYYFFIAASIENAVLHASRFGITGSVSDGDTREDTVRKIINDQTFGQVDMETVSIETLVYETFADIGEPEPFTDENGNDIWDEGEPYNDVNGNGAWDEDMAVAGLGSGGDIVLYRVKYSVDSLTGFADWAFHTVSLTSTVAVRNEPY